MLCVQTLANYYHIDTYIKFSGVLSELNLHRINVEGCWNYSLDVDVIAFFQQNDVTNGPKTKFIYVVFNINPNKPTPYFVCITMKDNLNLHPWGYATLTGDILGIKIC